MNEQRISPAAAVVGVVGLGALAYYVFRPDISQRYRLAPLWSREGNEFTDATHEQRRAVEMREKDLRRYARWIAEAPGLVDDNEGKAVAALLDLRSQYEVLWLNRWFVNAPWRALGVFDTSGGVAPQLGEYLDEYFDASDWRAVWPHLRRLPKYAPAE